MAVLWKFIFFCGRALKIYNSDKILIVSGLFHLNFKYLLKFTSTFYFSLTSVNSIIKATPLMNEEQKMIKTDNLINKLLWDLTVEIKKEFLPKWGLKMGMAVQFFFYSILRLPPIKPDTKRV